MSNAANKRDYYRQSGIVQRYDAWRFGSSGGRYVSKRELDIVLGCLSAVSRADNVLDLPIGTGRLAAALSASGFRHIYGADASDAMLGAARSAGGPELVLTKQDAFGTSFRGETFAAAVSLRFFFHFPDTEPLLREFARVLRPGGVLVFDSLRWSPRRRAPGIQSQLGGVVYPASDDVVTEQLQRNGFTVLLRERILLLPSLAYRYLPGPLVPAADWLERRLPGGLRSKTVWCARKEPSRGG